MEKINHNSLCETETFKGGMTDNEIKKALEICIDFVSGGESMCKNCPLYDCNNCSEQQRKQALDLINRKDAEIEKLNVDLVGMRGACESYKMHYENAQTEIERLKAENEVMKTNCNSMYVSMPNMAKAERTEAIKEFAERVKQEINFPLAVWKVFDNLVKEMTEQANFTKIEHNSLCETETYKGGE